MSSYGLSFLGSSTRLGLSTTSSCYWWPLYPLVSRSSFLSGRIARWSAQEHFLQWGRPFGSLLFSAYGQWSRYNLGMGQFLKPQFDQKVLSADSAAMARGPLIVRLDSWSLDVYHPSVTCWNMELVDRRASFIFWSLRVSSHYHSALTGNQIQWNRSGGEKSRWSCLLLSPFFTASWVREQPPQWTRECSGSISKCGLCRGRPHPDQAPIQLLALNPSLRKHCNRPSSL